MSKQGISVFDLDHTLISVNGSVRFSTYLRRAKLVGAGDLIRSSCYFFNYIFLGMPLRELHEKMFTKILKGMSLPALQKQARLFTESYIPKVWVESTLLEMRKAKERGDITAILSSSPTFLVQPIAELLGVDEWLSTEYNVDRDGRIESLKRIVVGSEKAAYALMLAEKHGIQPENIHAYTDSHRDIPLLDIAGKGFLVNPDRKLRALAKERNWPILT